MEVGTDYIGLMNIDQCCAKANNPSHDCCRKNWYYWNELAQGYTNDSKVEFKCKGINNEIHDKNYT